MPNIPAPSLFTRLRDIAMRPIRLAGRTPARLVVLLTLAWMIQSSPIQAQENNASHPLDLRLAGVKINVPDMDKALAFYRNVLRFEVLSDVRYPASVVLKSEVLPLTLERVTDPTRTSTPQQAGTTVAFQSYDLLATVERLKNEGITFVPDPPTPYGQNQDGAPLGISTQFRDPFDNAYWVVEQQVRRGDAFTGIRVYNTGFRVPDIEEARAFYCEKLGFIALTEAYYPNIPLGHPDGSFAFMLHGRKPVEGTYVSPPGQLVLVFETDDLDTTMKTLMGKGIAFLHEAPQPRAEGRSVAFTDSFGSVVELMERHVAGSR